jgi:hypothetical protein
MLILPDESSYQQRVGAERIIFFFVLLLLVVPSKVRSAAAGQQGKRYSVLDFHAAGDGTTDDAKVTTT